MKRLRVYFRASFLWKPCVLAMNVFGADDPIAKAAALICRNDPTKRLSWEIEG